VAAASAEGTVAFEFGKLIVCSATRGATVEFRKVEFINLLRIISLKRQNIEFLKWNSRQLAHRINCL
jgi:hypothetical protein